MNYRKLRKKYIRRFGVAVRVTCRDKSGKVMRHLSKCATAHFYKECLRYGYDGMELVGSEIIRFHHQESIL